MMIGRLAICSDVLNYDTLKACEMEMIFTLHRSVEL